MDVVCREPVAHRGAGPVWEEQGIPAVFYKHGHWKEDAMAVRRNEFGNQESVVHVGKAQAKARSFRTEARRTLRTGQSDEPLQPLSPVDRDFGPFFLRSCAHFPKLCVLGHAYAEG